MLTSKDLALFVAALVILIVVVVQRHRGNPPATTPPPRGKTAIESNGNKGRRPGGE
jgi:hypothetical protein